MGFFEEQGLDASFLRAVSQHQVGLLAETFRSLDLDPDTVRLRHDVLTTERAGFLALEAPEAGGLCTQLLERGVRTDARGTVLRFGPAPYHSDAQIVDAITVLSEVL
jgi:kynureninase